MLKTHDQMDLNLDTEKEKKKKTDYHSHILTLRSSTQFLTSLSSWLITGIHLEKVTSQGS